MKLRKHTGPSSASTCRDGLLQSEVYRQMFRLEDHRPGADVSLALALLRAWQACGSGPAAHAQRQWLRKICPICVAMIESASPSSSPQALARGAHRTPAILEADHDHHASGTAPSREAAPAQHTSVS